MARTLSTPADESLMDETTDEVWLTLLTISHPSLASPIRVVHNNEPIPSRGSEPITSRDNEPITSRSNKPITSRGNTFHAYAFQLIMPGQGGDGPGEAQLAIDNTDRVIVETIRSITDAPDVLVEVVLADTPDVVEIALPPLKLRDVTYNAATVTGFLRFEDLITEPVAETITPSRLPALF